MCTITIRHGFLRSQWPPLYTKELPRLPYYMYLLPRSHYSFITPSLLLRHSQGPRLTPSLITRVCVCVLVSLFSCDGRPTFNECCEPLWLGLRKVGLECGSRVGLEWDYIT